MRTFSLLALLVAIPCLHAAEPLPLGDGDRVVWLGNTLIEREQLFGWWELGLTCHFPGKNILQRNLGWSGDTVFGHARAGFGSVADGFRHLKDHTLSLKPTHILIAYGTNESFDGPAGLPTFVAGLETLLDALAPVRAKVVLLSPLRQARMGPPLPDPTRNNRNLRLYADAIRQVAGKRGCRFVDLYDLLGDVAETKPPSTDNGIHLTEAGYRWSMPRLLAALDLPLTNWSIDVDPRKGGPVVKGTATTVTDVKREGLRFRLLDDQLPLGLRPVTVKGLAAGKHTLVIDGREIITAEAEQWSKGILVYAGPEFDQREKLRQTIRTKNELYFHRWRPQNVTYLFGFRKHEQGQNAREIPQFDPLVQARENEIAVLSKPVAHVYEIRPSR